MKLRLIYRWPIDLVKGIYWCFIPLVCRDCYRLTVCREGFRKGRRCKNGCLRIKEVKKRQSAEYYNRLREEQLESLIAAANKEEAERMRQSGLLDRGETQPPESQPKD